MDVTGFFPTIAPSKLKKLVLEGLVKFMTSFPEEFDESRVWASCAEFINNYSSNSKMHPHEAKELFYKEIFPTLSTINYGYDEKVISILTNLPQTSSRKAQEEEHADECFKENLEENQSEELVSFRESIFEVFSGNLSSDPLGVTIIEAESQTKPAENMVNLYHSFPSMNDAIMSNTNEDYLLQCLRQQVNSTESQEKIQLVLEKNELKSPIAEQAAPCEQVSCTENLPVVEESGVNDAKISLESAADKLIIDEKKAMCEVEKEDKAPQSTVKQTKVPPQKVRRTSKRLQKPRSDSCGGTSKKQCLRSNKCKKPENALLKMSLKDRIQMLRMTTRRAKKDVQKAEDELIEKYCVSKIQDDSSDTSNITVVNSLLKNIAIEAESPEGQQDRKVTAVNEDVQEAAQESENKQQTDKIPPQAPPPIQDANIFSPPPPKASAKILININDLSIADSDESSNEENCQFERAKSTDVKCHSDAHKPTTVDAIKCPESTHVNAINAPQTVDHNGRNNDSRQISLDGHEVKKRANVVNIIDIMIIPPPGKSHAQERPNAAAPPQPVKKYSVMDLPIADSSSDESEDANCPHSTPVGPKISNVDEATKEKIEKFFDSMPKHLLCPGESSEYSVEREDSRAMLAQLLSPTVSSLETKKEQENLRANANKPRTPVKKYTVSPSKTNKNFPTLLSLPFSPIQKPQKTKIKIDDLLMADSESENESEAEVQSNKKHTKMYLRSRKDDKLRRKLNKI